MIQVNGYQLREALRRWNAKRDAASGMFEGTLKKFDDEQKKKPVEVMSDFMLADRKIAAIQVAQDRYNLAVKVDVKTLDGNVVKMTLAEAVILVGGAGRTEKMWRSAATAKKERYSYNEDDVRKAGEERARPVMTVDALLENAEKAARYASSLRAAIATGNTAAIQVEAEGLEAADLA